MRVAVASLEMERQTGVWKDPWFGEVAICPRDGRVHWNAGKSPRLAGTVMRVGKRYLVDWHDDSVDAEAWLDFRADSGDGLLLDMAKVDPQADFNFD